MRRFVILAGAVAAGALAWSRIRERGQAISKPASGISHNGMAYARWGNGPRTLLVIPGGPDNRAPSGMFLSKHLRAVRPLVEDGWTAWVVTRRQHLPQGCSIADMADDYGRLITDELGGRIDAALGISTGGLIGLQLAARHPERLGRIAIVAAGYVVDGPRREGDLAYARLLHEGRPGEAVAAMFRDVYPNVRIPGAARVVGTLMGPLVMRGAHASFRDDVLIEAEAEMAFDAKAVLPDISVPVLLVGGGRDQFFTRETIEETARRIPDCTLAIYEGEDHLAAVSDERLPRDVHDFVARGSRVQPVARVPGPVATVA
jgi:pimeloyl-ACP methyl ester carboxylesterase